VIHGQDRHAPVAQCYRADSSHDDAVSINELITAVGFSLNGCP
jgi:hypothetical protein